MWNCYYRQLLFLSERYIDSHQVFIIIVVLAKQYDYSHKLFQNKVTENVEFFL